MPAFNFNQTSKVTPPKGRQDTVKSVVDLRGLDLVTPYDLLKDGASPFAKNFRLYAQQTDDRRVAVSSRKGPGKYINPLNETLSNNNESITGAATVGVGYITGMKAQSFQASSSGRLTRVSLKASTGTGVGPLMVRVYDSDSTTGLPKTLLAESSVYDSITNTPGWVNANFIDIALLTIGQVYWIVSEIQDDGRGAYLLSTTTAGTLAHSSDAGVQQLTAQTYALNYRTYIAPDLQDKGAHRFNRESSTNVTLVAYNDTMYINDGNTGNLKVLLSGLNSNASEYSFDVADGKVFWVNGYDTLMNWNGVFPTGTNRISNPSFSTDTTGWDAVGGGSGAAIARDTTTFNTTPASLKATATSGTRIANFTLSTPKGALHKVSFWAKASAGTPVLTIAGALAPVTLSITWAQYSVNVAPTADATKFSVSSTADFFIDDVSVVDTNIEYITDTELPILKQIEFHKNTLFGQSASDLNKIVFSEQPGLPEFDPDGITPTAVNKRWYYAWLSVSFIYIPRPKNGSPITWFGSFQDMLTIMTQDKKYVLSGADRGSYFLRESTGSKGALSMRGVAMDENRIYFVANDGLYEHDGSKDTKISDSVIPLFAGCPSKENITPVLWKSQVKFYMASVGSPYNDVALIYERDMKEMVFDTQVYCNRAIHFNDADDDGQLAEFSSLTPMITFADQAYDSYGEPIDFEYRFAYDSMDQPAMLKRIKRFFPLLEGVDTSFPITTAMDKDRQDSPKLKQVNMIVKGGKIGAFSIGNGTLLGGDKSFKRHRQSYSGYASYWQMRVIRRGVRNRVALIGSQYSYKTKRL